MNRPKESFSPTAFLLHREELGARSFRRLHLQGTFRWDPVNPVPKPEPVRSSMGPSLPLLHSPNREAEAMHVHVSLEWNSGSKLLSCLNLKSQN